MKAIRRVRCPYCGQKINNKAKHATTQEQYDKGSCAEDLGNPKGFRDPLAEKEKHDD